MTIVLMMLAMLPVAQSWDDDPTQQPGEPVELRTERPEPTTTAPAEIDAPVFPPDQVISEFFTYLDSANQYEATARAFVRDSWKSEPKPEISEFMSRSYAVLSPEFKRGLDLLYDDKADESVTVFRQLAEGNNPHPSPLPQREREQEDPYMAVAAAKFAATSLIEVEQYEAALALLDRLRERHKPVERYTPAPGQFQFMLGYCQVHTLDYESAFKTLSTFLKQNPDATERLRLTAQQILTELARRAPQQLGDVRDLLAFASRHIRQGDTGEEVARRQQEAVDLLDKLIEEQEQQEKKSGGGDGSGKGQDQNQEDKKGGGNKPCAPMQQTKLPAGGGQGGSYRRQLPKPGEAWGKMPPKEREQIMQALQREFPSQYRELLEQYYKQLAKDAAP